MVCDEWTECVNGRSESYCYDSGNDNINYIKHRSCVPGEAEEQPTEEIVEEPEETAEPSFEPTPSKEEPSTSWVWWVAGLFAFILIIIGIVYWLNGFVRCVMKI